jgi:hypothetical protein
MKFKQLKHIFKAGCYTTSKLVYRFWLPLRVKPVGGGERKKIKLQIRCS